MKCSLLFSVAVLSYVVLGNTASSAEASVASKPALGGPVVKGMCVLNRTEVFASSKVAQAVNAKYRAAFDEAQGEVTKERQALEVDAKTLQAKRSAMKAEDFQKSQAELADKVKALQARANEQTQILETTRRDVVARIASEAQPLIEQVYKERGCGLLLSREAVLAGNVEMDITPATIAALDRKITDLPFERQATASSAAR
jgi:Skp family chaperone for outer membrane proteins